MSAPQSIQGCHAEIERLERELAEAQSEVEREAKLIETWETMFKGLSAHDEAVTVYAVAMREALEDIANPVACLQRTIPPDCVLDGHAAIRFADNAENLKKIARDVLAKNRGAPEGVKPATENRESPTSPLDSREGNASPLHQNTPPSQYPACIETLKDFLRSAGELYGDPENGNKSMKLWTDAIKSAQKLVAASKAGNEIGVIAKPATVASL